MQSRRLELFVVDVASVVDVVSKNIACFLTKLKDDANLADSNPGEASQFAFQLFNIQFLGWIDFLSFQTGFEDTNLGYDGFSAIPIDLFEKFIS